MRRYGEYDVGWDGMGLITTMYGIGKKSKLTIFSGIRWVRWEASWMLQDGVTYGIRRGMECVEYVVVGKMGCDEMGWYHVEWGWKGREGKGKDGGGHPIACVWNVNV